MKSTLGVSGRRHAVATLVLMLLAGCSRCARTPEPERQAPEADLDPPAVEGATAPNLMADARGEVIASWLEPAPRGDAGLARWRLRTARLAGARWEAPVTVAESESLMVNWADVPSVVEGRDRSLLAHWAERSGPDGYAVVLARSQDLGKTWSRLGLAHDDGTDTEHGFVSMVPTAGGVRAFWLDGRETGGGSMTLRTAVVSDAVAGGEKLDGRVCDCCPTAAAFTEAGPVVVYRDRSEDEVRDISILRWTPDGWAGPTPVHRDGWRVPGCPVNGPQVAARGVRVAVAWYTYAGARPRVLLAFSEDGGEVFSPPIEVDAPRGRRAPVGRVDMVLQEGGEAIVSWLASDREQAVWLARRVRRDGQAAPELTLASTRAGRESGFPRIERAGDALVALWTDTSTPVPHLRARRVPLASIPMTFAPAATVEAPVAAKVEVGQPAPEIEASSMSGGQASLRSLQGEVVLVNLWAIWCEPCRHELPELAALHLRYASKGLRVVAINVDRDRIRGEVAAFAERRKLPFTVWHDPSDAASRLLGADLLPTSYLVGRDGRLLWKHSGALTANDPEVVAAIERALSP